MLRFLFFSINLFACSYCIAQPGTALLARGGNQLSGNWHNYSPSISAEIHSLELPLQFLNARDYTVCQIIPGYFKVTIKCSKPWFLSFRSASLTVGKNAYSLVSLRNPITGQRIPMSNSFQVILRGPGHFGPRDYYIDLMAEPPFDITPGQYTGLVDFQVTTD